MYFDEEKCLLISNYTCEISI